MRPEDIIADFLAKLGPNRSPDDAARDLIAELEKHELYLSEPYEGDFDWQKE